jgi:phosphoribosylanthranilate isomerase
VDRLALTELQLHGEESSAQIRSLPRLPIIKAIRVRDRSFVDEMARWRDAGAAGILLDTFSPKARGGVGRRFDWGIVIRARKGGSLNGMPPIILAGGLTVRNIRSAIRTVRPWGVDVSSGVESKPGIKSPELVKRFIEIAKSAC